MTSREELTEEALFNWFEDENLENNIFIIIFYYIKHLYIRCFIDKYHRFFYIDSRKFKLLSEDIVGWNDMQSEMDSYQHVGGDASKLDDIKREFQRYVDKYNDNKREIERKKDLGIYISDYDDKRSGVVSDMENFIKYMEI